MAKINIQTSQKAIPRCYAYTTPTIPAHDGWTKIGYTEQDDVETRIRQQLQTANIPHHTEWSDIALFADGVTYFHDTDFHAYMQKQNVERMAPQYGDKKQPEWFRISGDDSYMMYTKFRRDKGILEALDSVEYHLREEQDEAARMTFDYFIGHKNGEFLWNAKPRFGKTLATYDLCKRLKEVTTDRACNVLIVTNRPAIANSWYDDYVKFMGKASGFVFVSEVSALKGKSHVMSREQYTDYVVSTQDANSCIEFVSLQDLKGSIYFGGEHDKLREIADMTWELLVIDEAHEGVDTTKTDIAFNQIKRNNTLHLSGTPFKALANDKFPADAIYNWTYADEQYKKHNWDNADGNNPYENLPQLNLFTYQMSEIVREELKQGLEINGETEEYAFDLNLFFDTKANGTFVYESSVDKFLDALTTQEKFPFSTSELRAELKHTFWLLDRIDSAKALAKKLQKHEIFKDYKIILAAGDGRLSEEEESQKSFDKVRDAVENNEKTITVSVGQLTTGVTIPEWTAVLMLSNMKSPALYMQAAFRSQNPWRYQANGELYVKRNAYVFDFDPARTLTIFEEFANDLSKNTSGGKGDSETRKQNVRELLNFFPVIGEDEKGEMVELDAEKVLIVPRKIRSLEVVRRGFMSNFLFQNISNIFNAPAEVVEIIKSLPNTPEGELVNVSREVKEDLSINDEGEVELSDEYIIGVSQEVFGDKIYSAVSQKLGEKTEEIIYSPDSIQNAVENLREVFKKELVKHVMEITTHDYGSELLSRDMKNIQKQLEQNTDSIVTQEFAAYSIEKAKIEVERRDALSLLAKNGKTEEEVNQHYNGELQRKTAEFKEKLTAAIEEAVPTMCEAVIKDVETKKKERTKETVEDAVRDHLRGFARTIPSFLMAYGDENTTLENFDMIIPDNVFIEVTSISLAQFRLLRDGGMYVDSETGEEKSYPGKLFDPVVFNDSVKEFLSLKEKLSDYFDDGQTEDIFDYIPPQKTNQIYTPKATVVKMVNLLEKENPGCFDEPDKTFADLYMKSGLYITEIVKRLFNSPKLQELYPDKSDRLKHIFEKQVYGLAPTEIIFKIATSFILGFDKNSDKIKHNFRLADALPYAKMGTLSEFIDELYGE